MMLPIAVASCGPLDSWRIKWGSVTQVYKADRNKWEFPHPPELASPVSLVCVGFKEGSEVRHYHNLLQLSSVGRLATSVGPGRCRSPVSGPCTIRSVSGCSFCRVAACKAAGSPSLKA